MTTSLADARAAKTKAETDLAAAQAALETAKSDASAGTAAANLLIRQLRTQVATLDARVAELEEDLEEAQEKVTAAAARHPSLPTGDTTTTTTTPATTTPVTTTTTPTPTRQTPATSDTRETNQRAQNLKAAFSPANRALALASVGLSVTAPTQSSLKLTRGGHADGSISGISNRSGSWIRSTTMALTRGGDTGKTVVHTDRELKRPLLEHFGQYRDSAVPAQIDADQTDGATLVSLETDYTATNIVSGRVTPNAGVSFSHRLSTSLSTTAHTKAGRVVSSADLAAIRTQVRTANAQNPGETNQAYADRLAPLINTALEEADIVGPMDDVGDNDATTNRMITAMDDAFSGTVHGVGGQFLCKGTGCMITVTGTYNDNVDGATDPDENDLYNVQIASPGGLYFRPSSAASALSLCDDATRCTAGTDDEYMVFGYWREDPTSAAAPYIVGVFAEALLDDDTLNDDDSLALPSTLTATYDGIAVGMYVEQDPNDPVDTHRQGEFTADVDLRIAGAPANGATQTTLSGTIDDFQTTPTGGSAAPRTADRWVVRLNDPRLGVGTFDADNGIRAGTTAFIDNLSGIKTGSWDVAYVQAHVDAGNPTGGSNDAPAAVTGTFETSIANFVHLLGAYGAQKR